MRLRLLWPGLGLLLLLPACSFPDPGKSAAQLRQNPHPKQRYDLTMTIANAPGPFAVMEGLVQYDVTNSQCLPPPNSYFGGYSSHLTRDVPFALTRVSDAEYRGTVYADLLVDEDYHGRGVCHWKLIQARVHLKATGAAGETLFIPSLLSDFVLAGKSTRTYFWKAGYPREELDNYADFGTEDPGKYKLEIRHQLFSVKLSSKTMKK